MNKPIEVLLLDDEAEVIDRLKAYMEQQGLAVETFTDSAAALARIKEKSFDVVVTDMRMDGPSGMEVLRAIRDEQPATQGILATAYGQIENMREAELLDAFETVHKPFSPPEVYKVVLKAAKRAKKLRSA